MIDLEKVKASLRRGEGVSADVAWALVNNLENSRVGLAYLAGCQAATLESLPASTSKSSRLRHETICQIASEVLQGSVASIKYRTAEASAVERCASALEESWRLSGTKVPAAAPADAVVAGGDAAELSGGFSAEGLPGRPTCSFLSIPAVR